LVKLNRKDILETFQVESHELLDEMEQALLVLERCPTDKDSVQSIFRAAHTFKGNATALQFTTLAGVAHELENLLDEVRKGQRTVTRELIDVLLDSTDVLREIAADCAEDVDEPTDKARHLIERLKARGSDEGRPASATAGTGIGNSRSNERNVRVSVETLERMLDLVGEIGTAVYRTAQSTQAEMDESFREVMRLSAELQEMVVALRMVPIGPILNGYSRTVRDLATAQSKLVDLVVDGHDVTVDTSIATHLRDPIMHMVRNAVDHGIETPERRRTAGKPERGTVTLSALQQAGTIIIRISDDGGGLNRSKILARAGELGLASGDRGRCSDDEVTRFIFEPGFSTRDTVTELSGRGVGMDVVRRNVEAIHGRIEVQSREGHGTTITMRFPLTLAMMRGFIVIVGGEQYVLPLESVVECLNFPETSIDADDGHGVAQLRGESIAFIDLRTLFNVEKRASQQKRLVVVAYGSERAGLVVDELRGEAQAVIKPLAPVFRNVKGFSGTTILGDGSVALILDLATLLQRTSENECIQELILHG